MERLSLFSLGTPCVIAKHTWPYGRFLSLPWPVVCYLDLCRGFHSGKMNDCTVAEEFPRDIPKSKRCGFSLGLLGLSKRSI